MRHPSGAVADRVRDVGGHEHSAQRNDHDRQQPQIPRNHEAGEFVKGEFGPLVNTAFERHDAAEVNHYRGLWNVEEQNRE